MPKKFEIPTLLTACAMLAACSGGSGGEGTSYDEQLSCFVTLTGVNAANRETGEELPGATNALLLMKAVEMEGGEQAQKVREDIHAATSRIQDIVALKGSPDGAAELDKLQAEAQRCSETFKS